MTAIEIQNLVEFEGLDNWTGLYAKGHHNTVDFMDAIIKQIDHDSLIKHTKLDSPFALLEMSHKIKHTFYRFIRYGDTESSILQECKRGRGAFPVTILELG